jgi:hypothetical protein
MRPDSRSPGLSCLLAMVSRQAEGMRSLSLHARLNYKLFAGLRGRPRGNGGKHSLSSIRISNLYHVNIWGESFGLAKVGSRCTPFKLHHRADDQVDKLRYLGKRFHDWRMSLALWIQRETSHIRRIMPIIRKTARDGILEASETPYESDVVMMDG